MMTKREWYAKQEILKILNEQGYPKYSKLLDSFDINLTKDPNVIGYMEPGKARIVLNEGLSIKQVSTIVRHEILHEYLTHLQRSSKHLGIDPKDYDKKVDPSLHDLINIAGDYEISNRGYTQADKQIARTISLNGQILKGLITEDDHPDWVNKSLEEMMDLLMKDLNKEKQQGEKTIQIGDMGDISTQELEDAERQANAYTDAAGEILGDKDSNSSDKKDAEKLNKIAQTIKNNIEDIKDDIEDQKSDGGSIFKSDAELEEAKKLAKRVEAIKKLFGDAEKTAEILEETDDAIDREIEQEKADSIKRYNDSDLRRFEISLHNFIRKEISIGRDKTWKRFAKGYAGSPLIRRGTSRSVLGHIPSINVYFDRSGSWDAEKTAQGLNALSVLSEYERKGEVKINLYYFSNNVHNTESAALREGGTEGQPILNHIEATKPDNVIIMTDSDISDCKSIVTVPGAVWLLFVKIGGMPQYSQNLIDHLRGDRVTEIYYFDV